MTRLCAFLAAVLISALAVTSACMAGGLDPIQFRLDARDHGSVNASFSSGHGGNRNHWSTEFSGGDLVGLDVASLRAGSSQPVRFAVVRDAGRLDCTGTGSHRAALGTCGFTADAGFNNYLMSRGMSRPSEEDGFTMMAVGVRRDIVEALHAAHYPVPKVEDLVSLTAVGIDGGYINGLARVGYRPKDLDTLLQFKALNVTPQYIEGFVRHGLSNLPTDDLIQLKALDISADYIASFEGAGYRNLSADQLVQLKALGVTADYARAVRQGSAEVPSPERLVELKAIGFRPR